MSWLRRLKHRFSNKKEPSLDRNWRINQTLEDDEDEPNQLVHRRNWNRSSPHLEDENRNLSRSQSIHAQDGPNPNPCMNRCQSVSTTLSRNPQQNWDMNNLDRTRRGKKEPTTMDLLPTPRTEEEFIQLVQMLIPRMNPPKREGEYDEAYDYRPQANNDGGYVHIEEALKGPQMNPTWRQKIFSQRPEDDDEELRKLVESRLSHYSPDIVDDYRDSVRYAALEEREYKKDLQATGGFEVGYYPYMAIGGGAITRYYCPPDTDMSGDGIIHLCGLALNAIQVYNSRENTKFYLVKVIKTMTSCVAGCWFYMTFEVSLPYSSDQLWTFEAIVFENLQEEILVQSVGHKNTVAGPYSMIGEEPPACSYTLSPFEGQR